VGTAKSVTGIVEARKVARELAELLRYDATHRLGLAEAFPQAIDREWTPEFFRKCQLAERLLTLLDQIIAETFETELDADAVSPRESKTGAKQGDFPRAVPHSRRRFRAQ
jgi:hypothetical protein